MSGQIAYALHVLLAFAAVGFLIVPGIYLETVAHTGDVPFIRKSYQMMSFHGKIGGPLLLLVLPVGIWAALAWGIPLTMGWLVAAYVAWTLIVALGLGYHSRRELRIGALATASSDAAPSPELAAAIADPLAWPLNFVSLALWIFVIWDMVARAF
jgi:hypothetical protein